MIDVTTFGADPTGNAPSNIAIQSAAAAHPSEALYFPAGRYTVEESIEIKVAVRLVGNNDVTLAAASSLRGVMFRIHNTQGDVHISGLKFDASLQGTPPRDEAWDALEFSYLSNVSVENCSFIGGRNGGGDSGIMVGNSTSSARITNCYFQDCSDSGVYVSSSDTKDVIIQGNQFIRCGLHQEGNGVALKRGPRRVVVTGNTFEGCNYGVVLVEGNKLSNEKKSESVVIQSNVFSEMKRSPVVLRWARRVVVSNNVFEGASGNIDAVDLQGSSWCAICGNIFAGDFRVGLKFQDRNGKNCKNNVVSGNVFDTTGVWIREEGNTTGNIIRYVQEARPIELNIRP